VRYQVGIAQQWYDELDNLAFSEVADERTVHDGEDKPADQSYQDQRRVHFTCTVSVSPGTCEVRRTLLLLQQTVFTEASRCCSQLRTCIHTTQRIKRVTLVMVSFAAGGLCRTVPENLAKQNGARGAESAVEEDHGVPGPRGARGRGAADGRGREGPGGDEAGAPEASAAVRRPPRRRHQQGDHLHRVQPQDQHLLGLASLDHAFFFVLCFHGIAPLIFFYEASHHHFAARAGDEGVEQVYFLFPRVVVEAL
jgi:hypothetical protein